MKNWVNHVCVCVHSIDVFIPSPLPVNTATVSYRVKHEIRVDRKHDELTSLCSTCGQTPPTA